MSFKETVGRLLGSESQSGRGGEDDREPDEHAEPSHVCQSCGEEYYSRFDAEVDTCRECGGVKVERV